jgi:flagellar hook-length control protein FliK
MDINLLEVLPVSKPPPESGLRATRGGGDVPHGDSPTFEETLHARQKEEKQTQMQAELAASQSAAPAQAANPANENQQAGETPMTENAADSQPPARISGGLLALLNEGGVVPVMEGDLPVSEGEAEPLDGLLAVETPVEDGLPAEGKVDFATALEKSLSQSAEEALIQPQSSMEVQSEKPELTKLTPENKAETPFRTKTAGEVSQTQPGEAHILIEQPAVSHTAGGGTVVPLRLENAPVQGRALVDMVHQITHQMEVSIQQGRSSLRVQLHPQELGGIDIRFASSSQGVSVTVYAEQASTGRLLEMQLNQLRQSLSEAGVNLAQLNIHHEGPSHQPQSGFNGHSPRGRSYTGGNVEPGGNGFVEGVGLWQNLSLSGVDYRV